MYFIYFKPLPKKSNNLFMQFGSDNRPFPNNVTKFNA